MKPGAHVLSIDDGPFEKRRDRDVLVVGVVTAGAGRVEAVLTTRLPVDAEDATSRLAAWARRSRAFPALRAVLLEGVTIGGLGVVDLQRLSSALALPVVAVERRRPAPGRLAATLRRLGWTERLLALEAAGPFHAWPGGQFQCAGVEPGRALQILERAAGRSRLPDGLRLAHWIAQAVVLGESRRR